MNEPHPTGLSPETITPTDPTTAEQTALLRHFDLQPAESLTRKQVSDLIGQLEADPDWQPHLQAWHRDKSQLHPDLFAAPPPVASPPPVPAPQPTAMPQSAAAPARSFREARWWQSQINDGSFYGYSFRQPSVNQTLVILESLDNQTPGWEREGKKRREHRFMNELATLSPELCKPGCSFPHELPADGDASDDTADPASTKSPAFTRSAPFVPNAYAAVDTPVAPSRPAWNPPVQPPLQAAASAGGSARRTGGATKWAVLLLLLAAGVGAYGYFGFHVSTAPQRDGDTSQPPAAVGDQHGNVRPPPNAAPPAAVRAMDSQKRAIAKYPELAKAGSAFNLKFIEIVQKLTVERSPRLQQPDWPERVADDAAVALVDLSLKKAPAVSSPSVRHAATPSAAPSVQKTVATPSTVVPKAAAATPAATPSTAPGSVFVTLDAVNKASANNYTYHWASYYGMYDISFRQTVGIDVKLQNMTRNSIPVNLRWAFFAREVRGNGRHIFAAAKKHYDLTPGQTINEALDSPMVQNRATVYYDYGMRYLSGSKYEGWLVQVLPEGSEQVIKQAGSTSYLEDYGKRSDFESIFQLASTGGGAAGR